MEHKIREDVRAEVEAYLAERVSNQVAIQEMRQQVRWFRLGRQACTAAEQELVEVVYSADRVLGEKLSATLRANRRKPEERSRYEIFTAVH